MDNMQLKIETHNSYGFDGTLCLDVSGHPCEVQNYVDEYIETYPPHRYRTYQVSSYKAPNGRSVVCLCRKVQMREVENETNR